MKKYYTRACNFYYGSVAKQLIKKKIAFSLSGNKEVAFNQIEIFTRDNTKISSKIISLNQIKLQNSTLRKKINYDLKKITLKRKDFKDPTIMGILNMTPDSFSDGGQYNQIKKANKRIKFMIKSGASIIDIGGESTRPGSLTIPHKKEWQRISGVVKNFKKKYPNVMLSIDTRKSEIMSNAIKYKADIINDVSS